MEKRTVKRLLLWLYLAISLLGIVYGVLGLIQLASYSGGPNFQRDVALYRMKLWLSMIGVFAGMAVVSGVWIWRMNKRPYTLDPGDPR